MNYVNTSDVNYCEEPEPENSLQNNGVSDLWNITSQTAPAVQQNATLELIARILPKRAQDFEVVIDEELLKPDNKDKFILESIGNNSIRITGTSGVSAANGFNHYLKYYLNCHISWSGDQINVPSGALPVIKSPKTVVIQDKLRYYQNVCTASYSMVWWDFKRWEREIDWMALKGINFPLAFNGQELIWRKTFQKFGLTVDEINDYFTGPAFLAWNRMGNVQSWAGPLSENWHNYQSVLQTQILKRMRSLGMIPVLPAFGGHVPRNITRVLPEANVTTLSDWGHFGDKFCCTTFLEPEDKHFIEIGSTFIEEYKAVYGTDHFYNTDLFNELIPRSNESSYLSDCGKAVYESLIKSDPKAIWVMQGWLFHNDAGFWRKPQAEALLTSVPLGKLLVLDLRSELNPQFGIYDGYYGQPFIWCMLHNFGGALGMYGAFNHLNNDVFAARHNFPNMVGVGLTPEGIEQNDIIYDFMSESIWYSAPVDLDKWVDNYVLRRYGYINDELSKGWHLLQNSVFIDPVLIFNNGRYVINRRPTMKGVSNLWYNPLDVNNAFALFVQTSNSSQLKTCKTFEYDLVDITRQYLQLGFDTVYKHVIDSYVQKNHTNFETYSKILIEILDDMNDILSTNEHFLLGNWIHMARALADSDDEKLFNEYNAKNQITLWGPKGNILDYANKHWAGLFADYYKPRWQLFIETVNNSLTHKTPYNQHNFSVDVLAKVELQFVKQHKEYTTQAYGNPFEISAKIYNKYKNLFETQEEMDVVFNRDQYSQ